MPRVKPGRLKARKDETEERVNELVLLMVSCRYVTHVSCKQLAEKWGVKPHTVENLACEASRRVRFLVSSSSAEYRARLLAQLETCTALTMQKGRYRDAIQAIAVANNIVASRDQQEQRDKPPPPDARRQALHALLDEWPDDMLDRLIQEEGLEPDGGASSDR